MAFETLTAIYCCIFQGFVGGISISFFLLSLLQDNSLHLAYLNHSWNCKSQVWHSKGTSCTAHT